jgi:hypothetical protein
MIRTYKFKRKLMNIYEFITYCFIFAVAFLFASVAFDLTLQMLAITYE